LSVCPRTILAVQGQTRAASLLHGPLQAPLELISNLAGACGRKRLLQASALGSIYDGEDVTDVVGRIEQAVWRSNGGMCHVQCHLLRMGEIGGCRVLTPCEDAESLVA